MKSIFFISSFIFSVLIGASQGTDTLTNGNIIKLHKEGFSKEILKSKILSSSAKFDVSIDSLMSLKKEGVPEEIINVMISNPHGNSKINQNKTESNLTEVTQEPKKINLASGIYYKTSTSEFQEIEPSILASTKTNGAAQLFVSGFINAKVKATLSGKESSFTIYESTPIFVFIFDSTAKGTLNSENNVWMNNARSPKEFLLVKLESKKNSREITVGKGNIVNSNTGIDDKDVVRFTYKKTGNGIYEVTPDSKLVVGEYCIMFSQGIKQGQSSKVFDFTIKAPRGF